MGCGGSEFGIGVFDDDGGGIEFGGVEFVNVVLVNDRRDKPERENQTRLVNGEHGGIFCVEYDNLGESGDNFFGYLGGDFLGVDISVPENLWRFDEFGLGANKVVGGIVGG